jgi:hypothetical protein
MSAGIALRRLVLSVLVLLSTGCGGNSSTGPSSIAISGDWTGTWQFVTSGVTVTDNVRATFTQTDTATGTWNADSGASGQFSFVVAPTVSGTFTITQVKVSGGPACSAMASMSGTVSASAMTLSVPAVPSTPQCVWATNNQFSLHR